MHSKGNKVISQNRGIWLRKIFTFHPIYDLIQEIKMNAYFKLPIKNLLHHKKRSVFLLLLFLCCIVFFLLAMYFLRLTDGYFRFQEIYNLNARTFAVSPAESVAIDRENEAYQARYQELQEELLALPHVETAFCSLGDTLGTERASINGSEANLDLYGANHKTPLVIQNGRHFQENERNAILAPSSLAASVLGGEVLLRIDPDTTYTCKIIGIYNDFMNTKRYYIPAQDAEDLNYRQREKMVEAGYATSMGRLSYTVIADDSANIAQLKKLLADRNYLVGDPYYIAEETSVKDFFSAVAYTISAALAGIAALFIVYLSAKCIRERKAEIGILKAIGYKTFQIRTSFFLEFMILAAAAYAISVLLSFPLRSLLKNYMNRQLAPVFDFLKIPTADLYLLALLGILLLLYGALFFSLQKINRITAAEVLKA